MLFSNAIKNSNVFTLNINKCQVMTFSRALVITNFHYHNNGLTLYWTIGSVADPGIYFDSIPKFDCHINNIVNISKEIIGFIN